MGKGIVVFILVLFLSALLRLESKLIVAACEFVTYELGKTLRTRKITLRTWKITLRIYPNHTGIPTCRNNYTVKRRQRNFQLEQELSAIVLETPLR
jgi:hypothetical protein